MYSPNAASIHLAFVSLPTADRAQATAPRAGDGFLASHWPRLEARLPPVTRRSRIQQPDAGQGREDSCDGAPNDRPASLVLARPYHMDPGIGHEIEARPAGLWIPDPVAQYLPVDADLHAVLFGGGYQEWHDFSASTCATVWPSSYSGNTNEILWAAKVAPACHG